MCRAPSSLSESLRARIRLRMFESCSGSRCEHYYECGMAGGRQADERRYFGEAHPSNPGWRNHDWRAQWRLIDAWARRGPTNVRIVGPKAPRGQGEAAAAGAAASWSLAEQSALIEKRWMRQFGVNKPLARSRLGAHFPPP